MQRECIPSACSKVTGKIFYRYRGADDPLAAIYRKIPKRRGRAKILASVDLLLTEGLTFFQWVRYGPGRLFHRLPVTDHRGSIFESASYRPQARTPGG